MSAPAANCSQGWYCTGGSYQSQPVTTHNATTLSDCSCPDANYTGGRCWPGTYCPTGSYYPLSCVYGKYCSQYGLSLPNGPCDPGYFCNGSATQRDAHVCPRGYYCELGTGIPTACPAGTMSNIEGATNNTYCDLCTDGYYCEGPANTNYTGKVA